MDIVGAVTVEENKISALTANPATIQLNEDSVRFLSGDEVVVKPDTLPSNQLMRTAVDSLRKSCTEDLRYF